MYTLQPLLATSRHPTLTYILSTLAVTVLVGYMSCGRSLSSRRVVYATWLSAALYIAWLGCTIYAHVHGLLEAQTGWLGAGYTWQGIGMGMSFDIWNDAHTIFRNHCFCILLILNSPIVHLAEGYCFNTHFNGENANLTLFPNDICIICIICRPSPPTIGDLCRLPKPSGACESTYSYFPFLSPFVYHVFSPIFLSNRISHCTLTILPTHLSC